MREILINIVCPNESIVAEALIWFHYIITSLNLEHPGHQTQDEHY